MNSSDPNPKRDDVFRRATKVVESALVFADFPKLTSGNDDDGAPILYSGVEIGRVERVLSWRDVGTVSVQWRGKVEGYRVVFWTIEEEPVFPKLAEARAHVRRTLAEMEARTILIAEGRASS